MRIDVRLSSLLTKNQYLMELDLNNYIYTDSVIEYFKKHKLINKDIALKINRESLWQNNAVHPNASWLGCSPDGYIESSKTLIEIKCPVLGETECLEDFVHTIKYIRKNNNHIYELKKNHPYYGHRSN